MQRLSLPVRRFVALSILTLLLSGTWLYVVSPLILLVTDRQTDIDSLSEQLDHLRAIQARRPALEATTRRLHGRMTADVTVWSGPSTTAIAAAMQNLVRQATVSGGGLMKSTAELGQASEGGLRTVSVRFQIEGPITTMLTTLEAIERARPRLFVDRITVSAPSWQVGPAQQPMLLMDISILGYAAEPSS
jgi:general secretion pathway protein M